MLISELEARLTPEARAWVADQADQADQTDQAGGWEAAFTAARRRVGAGAAEPARVLLLHAARPDADTVARLYHQGDAAERRAVLLALPHLPYLEAAALPLVEDALRTNDARLVAAAVGPYAARHLDQHLWRHAVLKCVFVDVPLDAVASLDDRADPELVRMLADYAAERTAAGRPVPDDVRRLMEP
ncbi:EboA domain-containing protein [Streptomyces sp. B6B3]|uniref:EboA domain-containing protein n=1 Tax=Streptomyces sp. B6B3 TaxID=3153570 RepID=UPI00325F1CF3